MHIPLMTDKNLLNPTSLKRVIKLCGALLVCSMISAVMLSCGPPKRDEAVLAYDRMMYAVRLGDPAMLWASLAQNTKEHFRGLAPKPTPTAHGLREKLSATSSSGEGGDDPLISKIKIQLDWSFESPFGQEGRLISGGESIRVIEAYYARYYWRIPLSLEEGEWRVDLASAQRIDSPKAQSN